MQISLFHWTYKSMDERSCSRTDRSDTFCFCSSFVVGGGSGGGVFEGSTVQPIALHYSEAFMCIVFVLLFVSALSHTLRQLFVGQYYIYCIIAASLIITTAFCLSLKPLPDQILIHGVRVDLPIRSKWLFGQSCGSARRVHVAIVTFEEKFPPARAHTNTYAEQSRSEYINGTKVLNFSAPNGKKTKQQQQLEGIPIGWGFSTVVAQPS